MYGFWEDCKIENLFIVTAQPEFLQAALSELKYLEKRLTSIEELAPGIQLCGTPDVPALMRQAAQEPPIFVRHLAPVQITIDLQNTEQDVGEIAAALASLPIFTALERGRRFAVQSRLVQTDKSQGERAYSSGQLNRSLAEAFAEETGAVESIKKPQIVVSVLCTMYTAYLGISALEVFGITLTEGERVLDLGAAPGGWTRLLLDAHLSVIAVDPANLDPRLSRRARLEHYRGYADNFLAEAIKRHIRFDIIVNDMRMDAREAARELDNAAECLRAEGIVISVFKLPHATHEINPLTNLKEALYTLRQQYGIVQARQLFHNRQEVTVVAAQPLVTRR